VCFLLADPIVRSGAKKQHLAASEAYENLNLACRMAIRQNVPAGQSIGNKQIRRHTMNSIRKYLTLALGSICGFTGATVQAQAPSESFPNKPVHIIVSFAPGGGVDQVARILGTELAKLWNQPVVIDSRPGAGGMIGAEMTSKAAPDGYLVQISTPNSDTLGPLLMKPRYDTLRDFTPITLAVQVPNVLVVNPNLPVKTMKELVDLAKSKPGSLSFASSGPGSIQQLGGEAFNAMTGAQAVHIPYKGSGAAIVDLVAGIVPMSFETSGTALPFIRTGKLRALAVLASHRSDMMPDVPTSAEAGFPGFEFSTWYGVTGPAGMPADITAKWQQSIAKVLQQPAVQERVKQMGGKAVANTPEQFKAFREQEYERVGKIVKQMGMKGE
jgi:tripartite-type tricarboxylate transporter receptor subunit TctC